MMAASDIAEDIQNEVKENLGRIIESWNRIGIDEETKLQRKELYLKHVKDLLSDMLSETITTEDHLKEEISDLVQKLKDLLLNLHFEFTDPVEDISLIDTKLKLNSEIQRYKHLYEIKKAEIILLEEKEAELCKDLGWECRKLLRNPLPTKQDINNFQTHLEKLSTIILQRREEFQAKQSKIIHIMADLKISPIFDFERNILFKDVSDFQVTDSNMDKLHEFYLSVQKRKEHIETQFLDLYKTLHFLWNIFDEKPNVRNLFIYTNSETNILTIKALEKEVSKYQEKKRGNIKFFVEKLREEIKILWSKNRFSPENQKELFPYYNEENYTEDLLTFHENELERLKNHYEINTHIYKLLEERDLLWKQMLALERNENQVDRYKNRGGHLLQEEKKRKSIRKKLPKIEDKLIRYVDTYKVTHGTDFLICGKRLTDIFQLAWDEHRTQKLLLLSERKQARLNITPDKNMNVDVSPNKKTPRTISPRFISPKPKSQQDDRSPLCKRQVFGTITNSQKRIKTEQKMPSKIIPKIVVTHYVKKVSVSRRKEIEAGTSKSETKRHSFPQSVESDYVDFKNHMKNIDEKHRSTLAHEEEVNIYSNEPTVTQNNYSMS